VDRVDRWRTNFPCIRHLLCGTNEGTIATIAGGAVIPDHPNLGFCVHRYVCIANYVLVLGSPNVMWCGVNCGCGCGWMDGWMEECFGRRRGVFVVYLP
jgi:hypothetical protein